MSVCPSSPLHPLFSSLVVWYETLFESECWLCCFNFFFSEQFSQYKLYPQLLFSPWSSESHSKKLIGWRQLDSEPGEVEPVPACHPRSLFTLLQQPSAALCQSDPQWRVFSGHSSTPCALGTNAKERLCFKALACAWRQEKKLA